MLRKMGDGVHETKDKDKQLNRAMLIDNGGPS